MKIVPTRPNQHSFFLCLCGGSVVGTLVARTLLATVGAPAGIARKRPGRPGKHTS